MVPIAQDIAAIDNLYATTCGKLDFPSRKPGSEKARSCTYLLRYPGSFPCGIILTEKL